MVCEGSKEEHDKHTVIIIICEGNKEEHMVIMYMRAARRSNQSLCM
jgi:hypothetical protein